MKRLSFKLEVILMNDKSNGEVRRLGGWSVRLEYLPVNTSSSWAKNILPSSLYQR
jgi:hypothetical protein